MDNFMSTSTGAVIYTRVSTQEQAQNNWSLVTQEKECRKYCAEKGLTVKQVFTDAGRSAKTTENRPEFQKMMDYCRRNKGSVQAIVVVAVSRFSRDSASGGQALFDLRQLGIRLHSVREVVDETPMGRFAQNLFLSIAQFENDQKSEKAKADMLEALERGQWTHTPPLGYLAIHGALRLDPARAPLVIEAFELFATGSYTKNQVLDRMNAKGLTTRRGRPLSAQTFGNMLRNPLYAGWLVPKKWGGRYPGAHQALISQETFDTVQGLLDGRRVPASPYQRNNPMFPLRRFIVCGRCGVPMTGSRVKGRNQRYEYYSCRTAGCLRNIPKLQLETEFQNLMQRLRPRPEYLRLMRAVFEEVWLERHQQAVAMRHAVEQRKTRLKERRSALVEAFVYRQAIDQATYQAELERLDAEEATIRAEGQENPDTDMEALWNCAESLLSSADTLWREATSDDKQRLQSVLFPKGITYDLVEFGTAGSCPFYEGWGADTGSEVALASPPGFEPGFQP
jgi:site-specific DNA recombinase